MAEDIVACPGCGKKFRIPDGAPGGTFQCTACNANVPYGKAAQRPAGKAAAPARGPAAKAAPAAKAGARHAHAAHHRHGAAKRGHAEEDEGEEEHGGRRGGKRSDKDSQTILWISVGAIVVVGAVAAVALSNRKPPPEPPPAVKPPPVEVAPTPVAPPPTTAPAPAPADPAAAGGSGSQPSGIGEVKSGTPGAGGAVAPTNLEALFVRIADVSGVTEQERAAMEKDVALLVDRDTGAQGVAAGRRLVKGARKSIPALLSVFEGHWKGKKWDDDREKIAAHEVQQVLVQIVKADRPGGDFVARYDPRTPVPPKDFERAARMWVRWWLEKGQSIEKFKDFAD